MRDFHSDTNSGYMEAVYDDLKHYIVIGLTGRCGSGCTATRDILCSGSQYDPKEYLGNTQSDDTTNEERDREIILNFTINNNILPFDVIRVRDILTTFILENENSFFQLLNEMEGLKADDSQKVKIDFYKYFNEHILQQEKLDYIRTFDAAAKFSKEIWGKIEEDVYDFIHNIDRRTYEFLFGDLERISGIIRNFLISREKNAYTLVYQHVGNIMRLYGSLQMESRLLERNAESSHVIARRINFFIKILRRKDWILKNCEKAADRDPVYKSSVHVVIDSIKNIFEASYLKSRYHSFYLVAVTLDDISRRQRLKVNKALTDSEIDIIDIREQPSKAKIFLNRKKKGKLNEESAVFRQLFPNDNTYMDLFWESYEKGTFMFHLQDVDGCIQNADILINNMGTKEELKMKIMRYVCLMLHPGLVPPTVDERCMQIAQSAKLNSGCISRQVGAVVCDKGGNVLSIGWNDASTTQGNECISCVRRSFFNLIRRDDINAFSYYELYDEDFRAYLCKIIQNLLPESAENDSQERSVEEFLQKSSQKLDVVLDPSIKGLPLAYCFKDIYSNYIGDKNQVHTRAQHGEEKALEGCAKERASGGTLYTTSSSCELCAKKALAYDIRRIVYIEPYSGITNDHILGHSVKNGTKIMRNKLARVEPMSIELFTGATQRAYVQLYTPVFPLKDELSLRGMNLK